MRASRRSATTTLRPAALLALLAILLRASIPGGFMLSTAKAGALPDIVVCTAHGLQTISGDAQPATADDEKSDPSCAFTAAATVTVTPTLLALAAPSYAQVTVVQRALADQRPGRGLAAPPPPTTGPPSLAS
jgi:hypothetical protein